jgi:dipeptidyl aminopeptidase/acylaminoacyl peptidase
MRIGTGAIPRRLRPGPSIGVTALAALVAVSVFAGPAEAAFPGANGKIAYTTIADGNSEIHAFTFTPPGTFSGDTRLTNNPATDSEPTWSPNGTQIAFVSDRDGNFEIYKMNADGTGQTRLTHNGRSTQTLPGRPTAPSSSSQATATATSTSSR